MKMSQRFGVWVLAFILHFSFSVLHSAWADVTISENTTLTGPLDLRGQGTVTIAEGVTLDVGKWYVLMSGLAGSGTITSSDADFDLTDNDASRVSSDNTFWTSSGAANAFANHATFDGTHRVMLDFSANGANGSLIIDYDFRANVVIDTYRMGFASLGNSTRAPNTWTFSGSFDGVTWYELHSVTGQTGWSNNKTNPQKRTFSFANNRAFRHYRIHITANNGDATYLEFFSLEYGSTWGRKAHVELGDWNAGDCNVALTDGAQLALTDTSLAADFDLTGFGNVFIPDGNQVRLNSHRLKLAGMSGTGTILNATEGDVTSPDTPERVSCAKEFGGNTSAQNLFNDNFARLQDANHRILVPASSLPADVDYELPGPVAVNRYTIWCGPISGMQTRNPKNWEFYGSADGVNWTLLDTQSGITWNTYNQAKTYDFVNDTPYRFYRMKLKSSNTGDWLEAVQFEYFDNHTYTTGTLEVNVAEGETAVNDSVALAGDIRFVKSGAGVFQAKRSAQTYTGGNEIAAGTLRGLHDIVDAFGVGEIVVPTGAVFDAGGWKDANRVNTFILDGGILGNYSWDLGATESALAKVKLAADSTADIVRSHGVLVRSGQGLLDLDGHVLDVDIAADKAFRLGRITMSNGLVRVTGEAGSMLSFVDYVDGPTASIVVGEPVIVDQTGTGTCAVSNLTLNTVRFQGANPLTVYGTLKTVGFQHPSVVMGNGSTLDLSAFDAPYPAIAVNDQEGESRLDFAAAATVTVKISGRTPTFGEQIIGWPARPQHTIFAWDDETAGGGVQPVATPTGLYYGYDPDSTEVAVAYWTGAKGNGDVYDYDNWNCTNPVGRELPGVLPCETTEVHIEGSLAMQLPIGSSIPHRTLVFGDLMLTGDCDWRGFGKIQLGNARINLNGYKLLLQDVEGGTIYGEDYDLTSPDGTAIAVTTIDGGAVSNLFNNLYSRGSGGNDRRILVSGTNLPFVCDYDFGVQKRVNSYKIYFGPIDFKRGPRDWNFYGSSDREHWVKLDAVEGDETWVGDRSVVDVQTRNFENQAAYRYYRLEVTNSSDFFDNTYGRYLELHELEFGDTNRTGEICFDVPQGVTNNPTAAILGNVRLVKRGAGTLEMTKKYTNVGEGYAAGTRIEEGVVLLGASVADRVFGNYGEVVVESGAELNFHNPSTANNFSSDMYRIILNGGTLANRINDYHNAAAQLSRVTLTADSSWRGSECFGSAARGNTYGLIDLGGHTLTIANDESDPDGFNVYFTRANIENGQVVVPETTPNMNLCFFSGSSWATNNVKFTVGCRMTPRAPVFLQDLELLSTASAWTNAASVVSVNGVFKPHTQNIPNLKLCDGATLDLSAWAGTYSENSSVEDGDYKLAFANDATIKVAVNGRVVHNEERLVAWATPPTNTVFEPATRLTPCRFEVRDDGLYAIVRNLIIYVR